MILQRMVESQHGHHGRRCGLAIGHELHELAVSICDGQALMFGGHVAHDEVDPLGLTDG
jgi:hypothetical protein